MGGLVYQKQGKKEAKKRKNRGELAPAADGRKSGVPNQTDKPHELVWKRASRGWPGVANSINMTTEPAMTNEAVERKASALSVNDTTSVGMGMAGVGSAGTVDGDMVVILSKGERTPLHAP
jgi:hypothetical protein